MIVTNFAEELRKKYRARMNDIADHLAGGGATSFENYKDLTGEIRGFAVAESMLLEMAQQLEEKVFQ